VGQVNGSVNKSRSVKSGISRGRSGNRQRASEVRSGKIDVDDLLGDIGLDDDDEGDGEGLGRAPY